MGLERKDANTLSILQEFAPCMGLESAASNWLVVACPFAPCMGLERYLMVE